MADNEVLKAILENELLTDEVRSQISDTIEKVIEDAKAAALADVEAEKEAVIAEARANTEAEVRAELATKFIEEKEELVKSMDAKVEELLKAEMDELREDISEFRDLEVEKALEIEEEKERLAEQFASEREALIAKLDVFVEARMNSEMEELAEDIRIVKENTFGRQVYEAFTQCFHDSFINEGALGPSAEDKIRTAHEARDEALDRVSDLEETVSSMSREQDLEKTLAPLTGKRRAVMENILSRTETDKFSEVYERMLPKVLDTVGNEVKEVNESETDETVVENEDPKDEVITETPEGVTVETGDVIVEDVEDDPVQTSNIDKDHLRTLAGIK